MPVEVPISKIQKFLDALGVKTIVDPSVTSQVQRLAKKLTFNMLNNVRLVSDACNCKTVRSSHLKAVAQLQHRILAQRKSTKKHTSATQSGGAIVLPPGWFGITDPSFHSIDAVARFETNLTSSEFTRPEHTIFDGNISGGAVNRRSTPRFIPIPLIESLIADYNNKKKASDELKVSKAALSVMRDSVEQNLATLLRHIVNSKVSDKVDSNIITRFVSTHPQFAHMR